MRVRRQRWRVLQAHGNDDLLLVTLTGAGSSNSGIVLPVIVPFDLLESVPTARRWSRASCREWRRAVRALISETSPAGSLRALARASMRLLPHQLEPALAIVRGICTRVLLADDVGLGKTIEAGLIVAELRERGAARRALVITPAGLREQWQDEFRDRFGIEASIADACGLAGRSSAYTGQPNPWSTYDVVITSSDLVKRPEHLAAVLQCSWDVVVVDEAHNATGNSDRHHAVHTVAARAAYVVLVTATPHNGDATAFTALCEVGGHAEPCAVFRRTRRDVLLGGSRRARRLDVTPTAAERRMHDALARLTEAVTNEHAATSGNVRLALAVLNKRALSSARSLQRSIARRLESLTSAGDGPLQTTLPFDDADGEIDARDDVPAWTGGPVLTDADRERQLLLGIEAAAAEAVRCGESKLRLLRRWLRRVGEPVIVFTEYRDTLQHVAGSLGLPSLELHGGLTAAERRTVLGRFPSEIPILLATDAAGEGLNLHAHCRSVINLELPWNPVRLEQRVGRVDRIGQERTVHALTLVAAGTGEQRILARLRTRIARARLDAAAGDPLGIVTEAEIEQLMLGEQTAASTIAPPPEPCIVRPKLTTDAELEAQRADMVRRVANRHHIAVDGRVLVGWTRHRETRARLGGCCLLLLVLTVEDGRGSVLDRVLLPMTLSAEGDPMQMARSDLVQNVITGCDAVRSQTDVAKAFARAFTTARVERERAIESAGLVPALLPRLQPGLFDWRAERHAAALRAASKTAAEVLTERLSLATSAASACTVDVRFAALVRGRR